MEVIIRRYLLTVLLVKIFIPKANRQNFVLKLKKDRQKELLQN